MDRYEVEVGYKLATSAIAEGSDKSTAEINAVKCMSNSCRKPSVNRKIKQTFTNITIKDPGATLIKPGFYNVPIEANAIQNCIVFASDSNSAKIVAVDQVTNSYRQRGEEPQLTIATDIVALKVKKI
jgi:hypothetical protein